MRAAIVEGFVIQRSDNKKAFRYLQEIDTNGIVEYNKVSNVDEATVYALEHRAAEVLNRLMRYAPAAKFKVFKVKRAFFVRKKTRVVEEKPIASMEVRNDCQP